MEFKYDCSDCSYHTNNQRDWHRHLSTIKHLTVTGFAENNTNKDNKYVCDKCSKEYKSKNGCWYHKKICGTTQDDLSDSDSIKQMLDIVVKNNNRMQHMHNEYMKNMTSLINKVEYSISKNSC